MPREKPKLRLQFFAMIPIDSVDEGVQIYTNLKAFIKTSPEIMVSGTINASLEKCCNDKGNKNKS